MMRYVIPEDVSTDYSVKLIDIFSNSVISVEDAQNLLVVNTLSGTAHAAASAIDSLEDSSVIGTIAGDDTVLIITKTPQKALEVKEKLTQLIE